MSAMRDMSRAIRHELQEHGETLQQIPEKVLEEYVQILGAFYADLKEELERRRTPTSISEITQDRGEGGLDMSAEEREIQFGPGTSPEDIELARDLGMPYATRCVCGHIVVYSWDPIPQPQTFDCCEGKPCPHCPAEDGLHEHGMELHQ